MAVVHVHALEREFLLQFVNRVGGSVGCCMFDMMTDLLFLLVIVGLDGV
jgi:hypothetical protein